MNKKKSLLGKVKSGQMMIEVLFALSVVIVVLMALMTGAVTSLKNTRMAKNMALANHYAQQAIENTRAFKNRNVFDVLAEGCYSEITPQMDSIELAATSINCSNWGEIDPGSIFERRIQIEDDETNRKRITATISWEDSSCGEDRCQSEIVGYVSQWEN